MAKEYHNTHKSECFWQVLFPLFLSLFLISSLGFFIFSNSNGNTNILRLWADISFMLITLPILDLLVILILLLVFSIIGLAKLSLLVYEYWKHFQGSLLRFLQIPTKMASTISKPFLAIDHVLRILKAITPKGNNNE